MEKNEVSASIFKALGHPLRVGIVRELLKGEKCVGDIVSRFKVNQANASQNLNILRINGIVKNKKKGTFIYYSLKEPGKIKQILDVLEAKKKKS
ncbi:MAG TPA: metalloregulator ArsR/SmtB family transcription factor [Deltaproteobacteria bacterium]|jgi:ArsR family transcriptional regulator|nr:metalloregulator ArsR/SmtB family transcription factor [Deltaproteobacteria bacterium]HQI01546.1 metalloregulator ArsR/SmtB family transcription factor [Deltaproteobacteria bacterium]HQJ08132.1 metalloregulator ArsR/SmtB family transcription factor [Deltaproteobacteria bacterium]